MYGTTADGFSYWTKTASSSAATGRPWDQPEEELGKVSFARKLADQLLRGQGMDDCASFTSGKCNRPPPADLGAPNWGYDPCCRVAVTEQPNLRSLQTELQRPFVERTYVNFLCTDMVHPSYFHRPSALVQDMHHIFVAFAEAVGTDTSCEGMHTCTHTRMYVYMCMHACQGGVRATSGHSARGDNA